MYILLYFHITCFFGCVFVICIFEHIQKAFSTKNFEYTATATATLYSAYNDLMSVLITDW